MAVSKFQELPLIEEAARAGIRLFGESRVQEALKKLDGFRGRFPGVELHMIGNLQRNKAKSAVFFFDCVQSADRESLLVELGSLTKDRAEPLPVLLELNAGEESKSGFKGTDALCAAAETALGFSGLRLAGLMTMAPYTDNDKRIRVAFRNLKAAQQNLMRRFPECDWSTLSMGMSGDFITAIEEGSTLVRIGTAIFGERTV
jgi:pyridoxal phosphate enzyme (YggS family)